MEKFFVKGLGGKKSLRGTIDVSGAKNAVLKAQAASVLFDKTITIANAPSIEDFFQMNKLLREVGLIIEQAGEKTFIFKTPSHLNTDLRGDVAKSFRSSVVLTGPVLAREGKVVFPHPGGCVIGQRPIDVFLDSFEKMGVRVRRAKSFYELEAKKMHGAEIFFKLPSVTATETLMMTAVLVPGKTVLQNCACEPEIVVLADFLKSCGADIKGAGTHTIIIEGGKRLSPGLFVTPPDRIEAGSFAVLAALCGKEIKIDKCDPSHMGAVIHALKSVGVDVKIGEKSLTIKAPRALKAVDIKTREYPGFPTDMQAPFSVLLTQAKGISMIFETVFEGRLNYLSDLKRMGADVVLCDPHRAIITGPTKLRGREMESPDLRAGLAFLLAGLVAEGDSTVDNIYNIDRGYEKIEERLNAVGAGIERIADNK